MEWRRITVELEDHGQTEVEGRETASGNAEWRGLPGTTFDTWQGGAPRTSQSLDDQVRQAAFDWFQATKMN